MQEIINFLVQNPEVIEKIQNGTASLLGVNVDEVKAILDALSGENSLVKRMDYWD